MGGRRGPGRCGGRVWGWGGLGESSWVCMVGWKRGLLRGVGACACVRLSVWGVCAREGAWPPGPAKPHTLPWFLQRGGGGGGGGGPQLTRAEARVVLFQHTLP